MMNARSLTHTHARAQPHTLSHALTRTRTRATRSHARVRAARPCKGPSDGGEEGNRWPRERPIPPRWAGRTSTTSKYAGGPSRMFGRFCFHVCFLPCSSAGHFSELTTYAKGFSINYLRKKK